MLKPKLPASRMLRGLSAATASAATEACYSICDTCVCPLSDNLNCCQQETGSYFQGCVKGKETKVCPTHRTVNACCKVSG